MAINKIIIGLAIIVSPWKANKSITVNSNPMIEKGSIIEKGKHYELLANKGEYYNLFNQQKIPENES